MQEPLAVPAVEPALEAERLQRVVVQPPGRERRVGDVDELGLAAVQAVAEQPEHRALAASRRRRHDHERARAGADLQQPQQPAGLLEAHYCVARD